MHSLFKINVVSGFAVYMHMPSLIILTVSLQYISYKLTVSLQYIVQIFTIYRTYYKLYQYTFIN